MKKKEMIDYLCSVEHYPTMNSWNNAYGYSFNVKIHRLPLTREEKDAVYPMTDSAEFYERLSDVIRDWREEMAVHGTFSEQRTLSVDIEGMGAETIAERRKILENAGWTYDRHGTTSMTMKKTVRTPVFDAGFNGRSGGHLVLYKWNGHNYCGEGWSYDRDELEDMKADEVKAIYKIVKDFSRLYDSLLAEVKYMASHMKAAEEEYSVPKTRTVLVEA